MQIKRGELIGERLLKVMRRNGSWCRGLMNRRRLGCWLFRKHTRHKLFYSRNKRACDRRRELVRRYPVIWTNGRARTVMASNFPQSHGGFLSELPGAVFTEAVAWQDIPNSIRRWGQGSSGEVRVGSGATWGRIDCGELILLSEGPGRLPAHTGMSHVVFVYSRSRTYVATCGWVVVGRFYSSPRSSRSRVRPCWDVCTAKTLPTASYHRGVSATKWEHGEAQMASAQFSALSISAGPFKRSWRSREQHTLSFFINPPTLSSPARTSTPFGLSDSVTRSTLTVTVSETALSSIWMRLSWMCLVSFHN